MMAKKTAKPPKPINLSVSEETRKRIKRLKKLTDAASMAEVVREGMKAYERELIRTGGKA